VPKGGTQKVEDVTFNIYRVMKMISGTKCDNIVVSRGMYRSSPAACRCPRQLTFGVTRLASLLTPLPLLHASLKRPLVATIKLPFR